LRDCFEFYRKSHLKTKEIFYVVWMMFCAFMGLIIGYVPNIYIEIFLESRYQRGSLDDIVIESFGDAYVSSAISEIGLLAFETKKMQARFYSKHNAKTSPNHYDIKFADAVASTLSAPVYFEKHKILTQKGHRE